MTASEVHRLLTEPFAASEVEWKPQSVAKGKGRAMACCYIDARAVMDRLDATVGPGGWQDSYEPLAGGIVMCRLRVRIDGEWVEKSDVGGPSDQPDAGDKAKAAFSDALKRAAVKFGVGRYLYRLPSQWVDYDEDKRRFKAAPTLPPWALPDPPSQARGQSTPAPAGDPKAAIRAAELRRLLAATGTDEAKFLAHYHAASLAAFPADKFEEARQRLLAKGNGAK